MHFSKKGNIGISLCRIIATGMILICHFGTAYGYPAIGQFFQAGVQIFLFISGLLYGDKKITDVPNWLFNRWKRISIPCYLYAIGMMIFCFLASIPFSFIGFIEILLNMEGYHHVLTSLTNVWVLPGTAHLWFITVISICYLIVAGFKYYNLDDLLYSQRSIVICSVFIISILSGFFGVRIDYFLIFLLGYLFSRHKDEQPSNKMIIVSLFILFAAVVLRLAAKWYCDQHGDNNFYLYVVIPISYNAIAFAIYEIIMKIHYIVKARGKGFPESITSIIYFLDSISYYSFITHFVLVDGPASLTHLTNNIALNIAIILFTIILLSSALKRVTEKCVSVLKLQE